MAQPSAAEEARRRFVHFTAETIKNTSATDYPGIYPGEDHSWSVDDFRKNFHVQFHESTPYDGSFSLIGINAALANAFRRILIAEVPTIAIETVYFNNNTSVIQDEVMAARLGLIPLRVSKKGFKFIKWYQSGSSQLTEYNTIRMSLNVECDWAEKGKELYKRGERDPKKLYVNSHVYAHQLQFEPVMRQKEVFGEDGIPTPVHPDILIAKLRPGQVIHLTCYCHKGIGADHAKFTPVATASYRLMPAIQILKPIIGVDAKKFARCFPRGVISLQPITSNQVREDDAYEGHEGELHAVVANPMKDTVSRECLRHEEFKNKVKLGRIQDHFIFRIESTGQYESNELFIEAVKVLKSKALRAKKLLHKMSS